MDGEIMETPFLMDDLGVPLFLETPKSTLSWIFLVYFRKRFPKVALENHLPRSLPRRWLGFTIRMGQLPGACNYFLRLACLFVFVW